MDEIATISLDIVHDNPVLSILEGSVDLSIISHCTDIQAICSNTSMAFESVDVNIEVI